MGPWEKEREGRPMCQPDDEVEEARVAQEARQGVCQGLCQGVCQGMCQGARQGVCQE
jgi:hypothetical protein